MSTQAQTMSAKELLEKRKEYLVPAVSHYYTNPPHLVKGSMQHLWDSEGKQYLDCFAGVVTVSSGHCHPKIAKKIVDQVNTLQHTTTLYLTEPMVRLAEKLAQITPGKLKQSFICNSGTEATEGAALLAKLYTGSHEFLALRHSFHGRSIMGMSLTGQSNWRIGSPYIFGVSFVSPAYCYRCDFGQTYPGCNLECAKDVENVIKTCTSKKPAAMIAEPIQGNGGVITPPKEYFPMVRDILKKYGALLISDEVQTGFGRTGRKWFGIEQWGVEPDMITMAKGFGNGLPIGGFITREEIAKVFVPGSHFSTFGGNPISCAGALANIEVIEEEKLSENAFVVGGYFKEKLLELKEKHHLIGDVRGMGLMLGMELVKPDGGTASSGKKKEPASQETARVMEAAKDKGVLIGKGGLEGNVIRIKPPMCITKNDVEFAVKVLDESFTLVEKG